MIAQMVLKPIISTYPKGLPFALNNNAVVPIREAIRFKGFFSGVKKIKEKIMRSTEVPHKISSPMEKYLINFFNPPP